MALERWVTDHSGLEGELALHLDPCRATGCRGCAVVDCPIRERPFAKRRRVTIDEAVSLHGRRD
jgi:hypothetical protein